MQQRMDQYLDAMQESKEEEKRLLGEADQLRLRLSVAEARSLELNRRVEVSVLLRCYVTNTHGIRFLDCVRLY